MKWDWVSYVFDEFFKVGYYVSSVYMVVWDFDKVNFSY